MPKPTGYRPIPADFREVYARLGWGDGAIEEHYSAGWKTIKRWRDEVGVEVLSQSRAEHICNDRWPNGAPGPGNRRRRFLQGKTMTKIETRSV